MTSRFLFGAAVIAALTLASGARAESAAQPQGAMLEVTVDHARVLKIDRPAESIIVGNPSIVDVTVHDSRTLVLTGRSFGITNLVILDSSGEAILDKSVAVRSFEASTVRIFRQADRMTYACAPYCEPTVTIGDTAAAFADAASQFQTRQTMATSVK